MTMIFGTLVSNDDISRLFFIFDIFIIWAVRGVKGQKMAQDDKKILSVALHISGTTHHMILIYGTHVKKDNMSKFFLHFFQFLIFRVNNWAKEQKVAWNDNYVCGTPYLSKHTSFDCVFCYTSLKWWHLRMIFSFSPNFGFLGC